MRDHYWRDVFFDLLIRNMTFALFVIALCFVVEMWGGGR